MYCTYRIITQFAFLAINIISFLPPLCNHDKAVKLHVGLLSFFVLACNMPMLTCLMHLLCL